MKTKTIAVITAAFLLCVLQTGICAEPQEKDFTPEFVQECKERAEGQALYGRALCNGWGVDKDEEDAVEWLRKAADAGNAIGQCTLGVCYEYGEGVEKDAAKAVEWFRKAAEQGHAGAQCTLGVCYANGEGVEKDAAKAVEWYRKAAEQGHAGAQCNLGVCYEYGKGVEKDLAKAVELYRKTAEQGEAIAQFNLGLCYGNGEGVEKDAAKAVEWFRKAAEQGHAGAQCTLGVCYANGEGVEKDAAKAVEWYRKAAEQGHAGAQCKLGVCYEYGKGVEKDAAKAVEWYRKAAEQGRADAQFILGLCYEYGEGVEEDFAKAVEWYRKAAEQGHAGAQRQLVEAQSKLVEQVKVAFESAAVATHGASSETIDALDPPAGRTVLMEFGTKCMPNAYAEFEKRRDLARELGQVLDEEFPNSESIGKDDPRRPAFEKVEGKFYFAVGEMLRQRNAICRHWISYKFGVETEADLAKVDSSKLETGDRLLAEPKQHTFAKFEPMEGKFLEFAAKYAPECSAAYQKMAAEYGDSHKLLEETLAQKAALNYGWTDGVLSAALAKDGDLVEKSNALSKSIQTWYYDHRTMEKTSEDVAKCDSTAALALKPFLDSLPTYLKNQENQLPIPMSQFVSIPGRDYKMCKYEVTQAQWETVMGENPSRFKGADHPVENVSWNDVQEFIERLNAMAEVKKVGVAFRLPMADEWEHACRAGSTGEYGLLADGSEGTLDEMGWYIVNSDFEAHPVGQKKPNAWGLYDMHGNVWEWTSTAGGDSRVYCGGSWYHDADFCESGSRRRFNPDVGNGHLGFRLALQGCETAEEAAASKVAVLDGLIKSAVSIPGRDYKMCKYEVTQAQWEAVMGNNPSEFNGADRPVENVSWNNVQEFIGKLNARADVKKAGVAFRLPTADEWEHACRAGSTGEYGLLADGREGTLDEMGWYDDNSGGKTHPVGQKKPNAWGLYDMHGNVWEWTSTADGDYRVNCGGSWIDDADICESADRDGDDPGFRYNCLGFRLALQGCEKGGAR